MYSFVPWSHYELRIAVCDQVNWCDSKWVRWTIWNWLAQIYWGTSKSDRTNNKYKKPAIAKMRQARSQRDEQIEKNSVKSRLPTYTELILTCWTITDEYIDFIFNQKKIFILLHLLYIKRYSVVRDFFSCFISIRFSFISILKISIFSKFFI